MGVDVDAVFIYGYCVSYDEIPDAATRFSNEFSDLADESDGYKVSICGKDYFCDDLLVGDNGYASYEEQNWFIGVGLPDEATILQINLACREGYETAKAMYELVMRKPPSEEPKLHVFARWW
jgi:hypothetical protein